MAEGTRRPHPSALPLGVEGTLGLRPGHGKADCQDASVLLGELLGLREPWSVEARARGGAATGCGTNGKNSKN